MPNFVGSSYIFTYRNFEDIVQRTYEAASPVSVMEITVRTEEFRKNAPEGFDLVDVTTFKSGCMVKWTWLRRGRYSKVRKVETDSSE